MTLQAFVIGWPISHSRSPLIHNYWLAKLNLPGRYERFAVAPPDLPTFLANLADLGFVGGNVTLPHKEKAFAACAVTTPVARRLQAVNTLWIEDEKLFGDNTDVAGFLASLDADIPDWDKSVDKAIVLGAGGAARGIVFALNARGVRQIVIVNRTHSRGEQLQQQFPDARIDLADFAALPELLRDADLLVNTTSLGMIGQPPLDIDVAPLQAHAIVADIVYAPLETALLRQASARGLRTSGGLGMLLHQAAPGFARWFGQTPQVTPDLRARIAADIADKKLMFILGLTGSIGMGKSATAAIFREAGIPVHDSDAAVHALYRGAAAPLVEVAFPDTLRNGEIDRTRLSAYVVNDPVALARLEAIVHPLVRAARAEFVAKSRASGADLVVLDIPLLFETGCETEVDAVLLVTAPEDVQKVRVAGRPGMTEAKLAAIIAKQMPDADKRRRADLILDTNLGHGEALRQVRELINDIRAGRVTARHHA